MQQTLKCSMNFYPCKEEDRVEHVEGAIKINLYHIAPSSPLCFILERPCSANTRSHIIAQRSMPYYMLRHNG